MKRVKKRLGFTLTEVIVTLLVISSIFFSIFYIARKDSNKMELDLTMKRIESFFSKYSIKAHYTKNTILIDFELNKKIVIAKEEGRIVERLKLSQKLNYEIVFDKKRNPNFQVEITRNGNLSRSFTLYILNLKNRLEKKITFYTFQKEKVLKINLYTKNREIEYTDILDYHYNTSKVGDWKEEGEM